MTRADRDPFLRFAGTWHTLPEQVRESLAGVVGAEPEARRHAWAELLARPDVLPLALALDLVLQARAASRMGSPVEIDRAPVRTAAIRILENEAFDGMDRWRNRAERASHVVALEALGFAGEPQDIDLICATNPVVTGGEDAIRAWISAAAAALRHAPVAQAPRLISALANLVGDTRASEQVRGEAACALDPGDATAKRALHGLFAGTSGDVRIEVLASLASRDALDDDEAAFVDELLRAGQPASGTFLMRRPELAEALERRKRGA